MTNNEIEIVNKVIYPLGNRLEENKYTDKLCQIIDCNMKLDPTSPFLNLGEGIRTTKYDYLYNELQWYLSMDCNINNHPGIESNPIWKKISTDTGFINSNYGYLVFDKGNYNQYEHALGQIVKNKHTKHAVIIYNRPEIVKQWNNNINAKSDFICTYATSFMIQDDELHMMVTMRSNDFTTGFFNDFGWQVFVYKKFLADIKRYYPEVNIGQIHWHTDNMHVYKRDYDLMLELHKFYKEKYK